MVEKRILIAEDDPGDAFLLERAFSKSGFTFSLTFVHDGQEAIDYLSGIGRFADRTKYPIPDLLMLDLKMPRMDGFEVLQWLRHQPGLSRMLVIVLTSSDQTRDVNRAYELGANSYLVKPIELRDLENLANVVQSYWMGLNRRPEYTTENY
jgi:CheY-like chemotaxis protein